MDKGFQDKGFLQGILSGIPAMVFIYDAVRSEYVWHNDKLEEILGFTGNDLLDMPLDVRRHFIHPDDQKILADRMEFFRKKENKTWSGVYRIRKKEGEWLWVYSKQTVYETDDKGSPVKFLGVTVNLMESFRTREIFDLMINERLRALNEDKLKMLTSREVQVITLIARGHTYQQIAGELNIQPDTVNKHRKNIQQKLNLHNIAEIAYFAKENGLA
jgi:PAS domain S-box-containing protein